MAIFTDRNEFECGIRTGPHSRSAHTGAFLNDLEVTVCGVSATVDETAVAIIDRDWNDHRRLQFVQVAFPIKRESQPSSIKVFCEFTVVIGCPSVGVEANLTPEGVEVASRHVDGVVCIFEPSHPIACEDASSTVCHHSVSVGRRCARTLPKWRYLKRRGLNTRLARSRVIMILSCSIFSIFCYKR